MHAYMAVMARIAHGSVNCDACSCSFRIRFCGTFPNPNDVRAKRCDFLIGSPARKIEWRKHWAWPAQWKICPKRGEKDGSGHRQKSSGTGRLVLGAKMKKINPLCLKKGENYLKRINQIKNVTCVFFCSVMLNSDD